LVAVLFAAMALRLAPMLEYAAWGSDWGEYYSITARLLETGTPPGDHYGWGEAYTEFQGFSLVSGASAAVTGVPLEQVFSYVMPAATALSCLIVACLVLKIKRWPWAALLAAAFLAFTFPEAFQNSHPVPGALGSVLALTTMLVFVLGDVWRRDVEEEVPRPPLLYLLILILAISLGVLHHLSLFFALIAIGLAHFLRALLVKGLEPHREAWGAWSLLTLMGSATLFWVVLAPQFRDEVMIDLTGVPSQLLFAIAWVLIVLLLLVSRWLSNRQVIEMNPIYTGPRHLAALYILFVISGLGILYLSTVWSMPGTQITPTTSIIPFFLPLLVIIAFCVGSIDVALRARGGHVLIAWMVIIISSFLVASVVESHVLISYRHLPYIIEVVAVFLGIGAIHHYRNAAQGGRAWGRGLSAALTVIVALLIVTSFPPKDLLGGFQEGTDDRELAATIWLSGGLPSPGADPGDSGAGAVATDHRLSSIAFGIGGQMATWDYAHHTLHSPLDEATVRELQKVETPPGFRPVVAVLVSEDVRAGVALLQWEPAKPIGEEAWEKFQSPPFWRLYDGGTAWVYGVEPMG
jgi:hypothetical protein